MRVTIEPISPRHAKETWKFRDNPALWRFMRCETPLPASQKGDADYYRWARERAKCSMFAILADWKVVGCCKLHNIANGAAELTYYMLDTTMWGKGICTEATTKLIDFGFDRLGLDLIYRYVDVNNIASMRVAEKQKFANVGISFVNQNVVRLEMTKTGWLRQKRSKAKK